MLSQHLGLLGQPQRRAGPTCAHVHVPTTRFITVMSSRLVSLRTWHVHYAINDMRYSSRNVELCEMSGLNVLIIRFQSSDLLVELNALTSYWPWPSLDHCIALKKDPCTPRKRPSIVRLT